MIFGKSSSLIWLNRILPTAGLIVAGVTIFGSIHSLVRILPAEAASQPYLGAWLRLWILLFVAVGAILLVQLKDEVFRNTSLALLVGLCLSGVVFLGLKNTPFALNGIAGDAGMSTAQVAKFAIYPGFFDFSYTGLPPFYPPLYFAILGKGAPLLAIEPYRMLKIGLGVTVFILPLLTYWMWLRARASIVPLAAIGSLLLFPNWYKPYEWLALVLFIPWWLFFVEAINHVDEGRLKRIMAGGLIGAALFTTYYYWFFIGAMALAIQFFIRRTSGQDQTFAIWVNRFLVLGASAIFSAPYWMPLLASMWATGGWSSLQNLYFLPDFNTLYLPFLEVSFTGLVTLAGFIYLIQSCRRSRISSALMSLLAGAYAWQVLGYVALLANTPLLTFKSRDFISYLLGLAAVIGLFESFTILLRNDRLRKQWGALTTTALVVGAVALGQNIVTGFTDGELMTKALTTTYPQELAAEYEKKVSDRGLGHVILADTSAYELSVYSPAFQFISWAAVYSHPAGLYEERVAFLKKLSTLDDPFWFAVALMNNRFSKIDELILFPQDEGYVLGYLPSNFPVDKGTLQIFFAPHLLDPIYFEKTNLGPYKLFIVKHQENPLNTSSMAEGLNANNSSDLSLFLHDFQDYLDLPALDALLAGSSD